MDPMPKQQRNIHLLVPATRWFLAMLGTALLMASSFVAPVSADAAPVVLTTRATAASAGKATPATRPAPRQIVLTKWQKESRVIKQLHGKSKLKVTKHNKRVAKLYAKHFLHTKYKSAKTAQKHYKCIVHVFQYESGWNWRAHNSRGYFGLPQTKHSMKKYGKNWRHHYEPQVKWGYNYMKKRYGSPCGAWKKIKRSGWY